MREILAELKKPATETILRREVERVIVPQNTPKPKVSVALLKTVEWIRENDPGASSKPPFNTLSYADVMRGAKVSKGTVHNAWTHIKEEFDNG